MTLTADQARTHAHDYTQHAITALPEHTEAKLNFDDTYNCDDPTDGLLTTTGPGRVIASVEYQLTGLDPDDYPTHFDQLETWWRTNGFTILVDARPHGHYLWAEHTTSGFRMALQANDRDELFIMCSSPCVTPD